MKTMFKTKERDDSFKWPVGTLLRPESSGSYTKWGFVILIEHKKVSSFDPTKPAYLFYSQFKECE